MDEGRQTRAPPRRKLTKSKKMKDALLAEIQNAPSTPTKGRRRRSGSGSRRSESKDGSVSNNPSESTFANGEDSSVLQSPGSSTANRSRASSSGRRRKLRKPHRHTRSPKKTRRAKNKSSAMDGEQHADEYDDIIDDPGNRTDKSKPGATGTEDPDNHSDSRNNRRADKPDTRRRPLPEGLKLISVASQELIDIKYGEDSDSDELEYPSRSEFQASARGRSAFGKSNASKDLSAEAPHQRYKDELSDGSEEDSFFAGDDDDDPNDYRRPSTGYDDDDISSHKRGADEPGDDEDSVEMHLMHAGVDDNSEGNERNAQLEHAPASFSSRDSQNIDQLWSKRSAIQDEEDGETDSFDSREVNDLEEQERYQRRNRFFEVMFAMACCCCIAVIAVILIIVLLNRSNDNGRNTDNASTPRPTRAPVVFIDDVDDDYIYNPVLETLPAATTDMAISDQNCNFGDRPGFANVLDQCECNGQIAELPSDVVNMHGLLSDVLLPLFYPSADADTNATTTSYSESIQSCAPSNLAMIWLASGNMRDSGFLRQRFALAVVYFAMQGWWDRRWDYTDAWLTELDECLWLGVQCTNQGVVNSLALDTNNVYGTLPTEIAKLDGLAALSLSRNRLSGTIPTDVFSLPRLKELRLYSNLLRGRLPTEVGLATSLRSLQVQTNNFAAQLPTELGLLTELTDLNLGFNQFRRSIPSELGALTALRTLRMTDNRFSGFFPSELGFMTSLENVTLSDNTGLIGSLPTTIGNLENLLQLRIDNTGMGGTLPSEMGLLSKLYELELVDGNFAGEIPTDWGRMSELHFLSLTANDNIVGTVPSELGRLTKLVRLSLDKTMLSGELPEELGSLSQLEAFDISETNIMGSVPSTICSLRTQGDLDSFAAPCSSGSDGGFQCQRPTCCTRCRSREEDFF